MKVKRKLLSVFLVISMLAGILPLTALPVYAANPPATDVSVYTTEGNQTLDSMYPYLVNGKKAKTGTLGSGGCTAYFDHTTGILTLQNHSGGNIVKGSLGGKKDLTVKLVGTNALTSALQNISGGDLIITAEDTATLSITNNTDTNGVITGISTDITGVNAGPGSITIRGKANISIYVENISTGVESGVRGIFAKQDISILDNASVNIECIGKGTGSYPVSGIQSTNKSVTFNTTGKVNIDCSDAQNKNPYAINNMLANILTSVDELTLKWTNGGRGYSLVDGGMSYDVTSFTRNIKEATPTQPGIEVFKKGTPLTLTIENGKNNFGKKEGQFTHGETVNVTANSITGLTFKKWVATAGIIGCATDSSTTLTMPDENVTLTAIYDVFAVQPKSAYVSATSRKVTFSLKATPTTYAPRLVTESGDYNDIVGETTFGHDGALNYSEVIRCIGIFDVPNGNYRIAAKFDDVWYYSDVFTVDYSTHSITVDGDAVETTDYTITGVSDFSSIPDGTNLTINAVNDINVDGENVVAGSSKTIVINSSYTITINKKVSNSAPTVVVGKETQTGNATPKASSGIPAAIAYEADMSGWFNDADGDALTYSVVSAREGTNDVSAHVSVAGKHITYTPAAAQAGKNVIIKIKANDGLADSTDNVTITVTVEEVPADAKIYKVTVAGDAAETTDYTISGATDLNAVPDGTNLTIYAVNNITVNGEIVTCGNSKNITINSAQTITINKKVGNSAPTVVAGKEAQTGNATPEANCGHPEAVMYEADMSGWFNDVDGDVLTYSVVSATEGTNDVSAHVSVAGKHITYIPAAAQAGKNVIIKIKANDGLADSTGDVTITVSVAAVPADTTYKVTIYGNAVITTDYTVSVADLNAVPHGTDLIIYAVNDITVSGEDVAAGGSKTIASIVSPCGIEVKKKNNAPTVVAGKETQTGNATPEANCGHPEAVRYEADMSGWFNDVDGDTLTYSVVSATEGTNDVSAHVSVAGKHITYTPAAAQAGKNVIIKIKANDGLADSTGNVTITVSVAAVPADTTYVVTVNGDAVITTDYTVSIADLNAVPHGTDLIIYAVNDITVDGAVVVAGGSKTIASIISPYNITVNKKTGNNAPTVVVGKETQTGNATPKANCGHPEAVRYEADMSGWFNDVDGDVLTYSLVSATEGTNDVSGDVYILGADIRYTPAATQAGKDVIIVVKANDGSADSTGNVTIIVSVAAVPADTTYKVTMYGDAVITTDYTVSVADLNAVPHGTNLTINAVNNIIVDGESVAAGGSKVITINSSQTITVNKVAIPKHTVTYDVDGGSLAAPTQDDVAEGATFAVASYAGTKAGFTFGGWNDGSSDYVAGAVYTMGTLNVTLTAVWNVASIAVTGVKLDSSTLTLTAGGSAGTLTATVLPMDAANKNITWASSDTSTATVSNGVVTPVAAGTATITVTTEDGGKTATCTVKVVPAKPTGLVAIKPTTAGGTDGMITGTSAIMEYANNVSFTGAVNCIGTKITNLSAGTYYVRVKATVAHDAGEATTVVVPAFVAIEEEDEDIYIPVTASTIPANNGAVNIGYIESEGVVSLDLTDDKIEEIIKKSSKGNVDFNVSGIENATSVEIPKEAFAAFGKADMSVTVKLPDGSITLDKEAVDSVSEQAEGDSVNIELSVIEAKELNHLQEQSVKADDIVVDINISDGKGNLIKTFDGELTIQIPYKGTLPVTVWYLNNAGQLEKIEATYKEGIVTFKLNHLSVYVLGQDKDRTKDWDNPFTDVNEKDWYYDSVKFAHMNKLMYGVGYKQFDPHGSIPRGLLLTVLHRLEKTPEPKGYGAFKDVAANKYYSKAVNWAAENNIVTGYGDGNFGPNDLITREHLALILMNYAKYKGFDTSKKADLEIFADSKSISIWAKEAMAWVVAEDIYVGDQANLNPAGNATRCQVAAIFKRFIENVE